MNREKILSYINEVIIDEEGKPVTEDNLLIDSEADSFGISMILISIDDRFNIWTQEEMEAMDVTTLTVKEILDKVEATL